MRKQNCVMGDRSPALENWSPRLWGRSPTGLFPESRIPSCPRRATLHAINVHPALRALLRIRARFALYCLLIGLIGLVGCANKRDKPLIAHDPRYTIADWSYAGHPGRLVTTAHYELFTTVTEANLLKILPQVLETAYLNYQKLVPGHEPAEKMKVYMFVQRGEFEHFTRRLAPEKAETLVQVRNGGYSERGVTVVEYTSHEFTFPLMTHEAFHQYLNTCVHPDIPAWLNEGLAVCFEGQYGSAAGIRAFDFWFNPSRRGKLVESLQRQDLFTLDELLRINAGNVVGGSLRRIGAYYGQVWALILFLREGADGKYAAGFQKMLEAISQGKAQAHAQAAFALASDARPYSPGAALFEAFISPDIEAVNREYVRFMRQRFLGER